MRADSISAAELKSRLGSGAPPIVIDVRRQPAFNASREMLLPLLAKRQRLPHAYLTQ